MKSLMEEASSVAKAIEQGWARAGKPKEFTVRIYEEPEKNFIGFTKKPAKVALFFKDVTPEPSRMKEIERLVERREAERSSAKASTMRPEKERRQGVQRPAPQGQQQYAQMPQQARVEKWTPEMIQKVKSWMEMVLRRLNKGAASFTVNAKNYSLTIQFSRPILDDNRREQLFFRATSHLLLQSLKTQLKKGLKGYKIIIVGQ